MKKKTLIILAFIISALIIAAVVAFFVTGSPSGNQGVSTTADAGVSQISSSTLAGLAIPQGDTIQLGTPSGVVTVKNFYHSAIATEDEFLILSKTSDYEITYDTTLSAFYIEFYVSSTQAAILATQNAGETALISMLGVNNGDACKLNIHEGLSGSAFSATAQPGLSFCPGSIPLPQ